MVIREIEKGEISSFFSSLVLLSSSMMILRSEVLDLLVLTVTMPVSSTPLLCALAQQPADTERMH